MKNETLRTDNLSPLLSLYVKNRNDLLADLERLQPDEASTKIGRFVRQLERPYTDYSELTKEQTHLAHYLLNIAAEAAETIKAVTATAISVGDTEMIQAEPDGPAHEPLTKSLNSAVERVRRMAVFYFVGIILTCVGSIAVIFYVPSVLAPIIAFIVIAIVATVGATATFVHKPNISLFLPALTPPFLPTAQEPEIYYSFDVNVLDGKITSALRLADELLTLSARKAAQEKKDDVRFDPKRTLELFQSLASHRIVRASEKSADALADEAIHLLRTMHITLAEYTDEQADFFEKQPAGITEHRTLLPALINDKGDVVCQGVVLVPVR